VNDIKSKLFRFFKIARTSTSWYRMLARESLLSMLSGDDIGPHAEEIRNYLSEITDEEYKKLLHESK